MGHPVLVWYLFQSLWVIFSSSIKVPNTPCNVLAHTLSHGPPPSIDLLAFLTRVNSSSILNWRRPSGGRGSFAINISASSGNALRLRGKIQDVAFIQNGAKQKLYRSRSTPLRGKITAAPCKSEGDTQPTEYFIRSHVLKSLVATSLSTSFSPLSFSFQRWIIPRPRITKFCGIQNHADHKYRQLCTMRLDLKSFSASDFYRSIQKARSLLGHLWPL